MMSDQASAMIVIGSSHSSPVISLFGNIACGKSDQQAPCRATEPIAATSSASQTTQTCGLSVWASCWARPRFRPERRQLRRELDDQHRISEAAERLGAVDAGRR